MGLGAIAPLVDVAGVALDWRLTSRCPDGRAHVPLKATCAWRAQTAARRTCWYWRRRWVWGSPARRPGICHGRLLST